MVAAPKADIHSVLLQHPVQTFTLAKGSLLVLWMQSLSLIHTDTVHQQSCSGPMGCL